ncbi:MAG: NADH-quinone oxidoreductase subunit J [Chloroflexi bacterium]|nr:NADH-quinone oxidoreductase subunit J [Chloroflexota bacterium]
MSGELILFFILALTAIATAAGMLTSSNAVYAALYLVLNFGTVAIFYLMLGSPFIALSQVTVYGGAIMVLFLFVIMLLGVEKIPAEFGWKKSLPAIALGIALIAEVAYLVSQKVASTALETASTVAQAAPSPLANKLFTVYLLPFEVTSILLLVAMVGAIVLTKQEKKGERG